MPKVYISRHQNAEHIQGLFSQDTSEETGSRRRSDGLRHAQVLLDETSDIVYKRRENRSSLCDELKILQIILFGKYERCKYH